MHVLPVIDLKRGQVVRGIAGQRASYRPIKSVLTADAEPASVARALVERLGFSHAYVADLDALEGLEPQWDALRRIAGAGISLLVDAGVGTVERARQIVQLVRRPSKAVEFSCLDGLGRPSYIPLGGVILALESIASPAQLAELFQAVGAERSVFSLDLKHGRPLTTSPEWRGADPLAIAATARGIGFRRLLTLDLARVGVGEGVGLEPLCGELRRHFPEIELIAGGGVRGLADIHSLLAAGCNAVLVASALHDGRLTRADLEEQ